MSTNAHAIATGLFSQLEEAWNAGDGLAFGEPFAADADFVDIRGDHHRGQGAIGAGHEAILDSIYKASTMRYVVNTARYLSPGTLLAHATGRLDAPAGPLRGVNDATCSIVATVGEAGWEIAAFHNTLTQG